MDRRDTILAMFDPSGFGLEIGPSYNPLLPKADGYTVETIDYADQAALRAKYADNPTVDPSRIEPVDYVSAGRPMSEVIGEPGRYDFIVASHVIEHMPDMIGFLNDCERLLKPAGVLVLAVPDKRACFDVFQRLTSTGEVIDAHRAKRTRPSYGSIFDEVAYGATQGGAAGWGKVSRGERQLAQSFDRAAQIASAGEADGHYVDVHVWRFVPSSFELILGDLFEAGEIGLRLQRLVVTDEFLAVLSRTGGGSTRTRIELLDTAIQEHALEHVVALREALAERDVIIEKLTAKAAAAGRVPQTSPDQVADAHAGRQRAEAEPETRPAIVRQLAAAWQAVADRFGPGGGAR